MNVSNWNVDELVANVMSDLRAAKVAVDGSASAVSRALTHDFSVVHSSPVSRDEAAAVERDSDQYKVEERTLVVETVRAIATRTTCKRWSVPTKALITPAARDELKKLGVELVERAQNGAGEKAILERGRSARYSAPSSRARVLAITHAPHGESPSRAISDYLARNAELDERIFDCLKETTRVVSEQLATARDLKVVIATSDTAIALIWANRYRGVRAVAAFNADQARADIDATNANVVIVNPRTLGSYQLRRILDYFVRAEQK